MTGQVPQRSGSAYKQPDTADVPHVAFELSMSNGAQMPPFLQNRRSGIFKAIGVPFESPPSHFKGDPDADHKQVGFG
jgi:hypothetical protein